MDAQLQKIKDIIVRVCLGKNTVEDDILLEKWLQEEQKHKDFFQKITNRKNIEDQMQALSMLDIDRAFERNRRMLQKRAVNRYVRRSLPYAAIFFLTIGLSLVWLNANNTDSIDSVEHVLLPGHKQAELIRENGVSIQLAPDIERKFQEKGVSIIITGNKIDYSDCHGDAAEVYNTIRTPVGGEYSITLSDGTEVWLNALSELVYPVHFQGNERRVKLKGEAYFKVKKETGRPFYVDFFDYRVKVLGTTFNIKAYGEEEKWQTTLCSGSVCLSDINRGNSVVLTPGEQGRCDKKSGQIQVKEVDTELYTAWTNGEFRFDNTSVEEIFNVLRRWYRIDVFFENNEVRKELFTGKLPRFDNLRVILDIMEKVSDVRFEMKGTTLIIK